MAYTEVKTRNGKKYFYRVVSIRRKDKISKERVYLGVNLSKSELIKLEATADSKLIQVKKLNAIERIKLKILPLLIKNKIKRAGIFGSYARGEQKKNSDVDIVVELGMPMGFDFFNLNSALEEKLKKKVHLVTYPYISPYIKDRILEEEVEIL